jgi:uncharacterized protein
MVTYRTKELYGDFYENKGKPLITIIGDSIAGIPTIGSSLFDYLN